MARRRHRRRFNRTRLARSRMSRMHRSIWHKAIVPASFTAAFLGQITNKDFASNAQQGAAFQNADMVGKLKFLTNDIVGRITGINIFNDTIQFKQTINPAGVINKYVGLGLLMNIVYPMIPRVPGKGLARKAGGALIAGGFFGGLFDDPVRSFNRSADVNMQDSWVKTPVITGGFGRNQL